MSGKATDRYPFLDGWRGIAILMVLLHHMHQLLPGVQRGPVSRFLDVGILGVDMFFVISGFLITGVLVQKSGERIQVRRFYVRRFLKIVPSYAVAVTVGMILVRHRLSWSSLAYVFFLQNYMAQVGILSHTWTLSIEEHFYFLYPLLLRLLWRLFRDTKARLNVLALSCSSVILFCNIVRIIGNGEDFLSTLVNAPLPFQTTLFRFDALAFGCLLRVIEIRRGQHVLSEGKWIGWVAALFGLSCYAFFLYRNFNVGKWYHVTLAYLAPSSLFIATSRGTRVRVALFENSWLTWIGRNSYGIYLWHHIALFVFPPIRALAGVWNPPVFVLTSIVLGAVSTATIEKYFLKVRDRISP